MPECSKGHNKLINVEIPDQTPSAYSYMYHCLFSCAGNQIPIQLTRRIDYFIDLIFSLLSCYSFPLCRHSLLLYLPTGLLSFGLPTFSNCHVIVSCIPLFCLFHSISLFLYLDFGHTAHHDYSYRVPSGLAFSKQLFYPSLPYQIMAHTF